MRSLIAQRCAAALVARAPSLGHGHIGAIVDALVTSGIDLNLSSGTDIAIALNTDGAASGLTWPDQLTHPARYLRWRLARLDPATLAATSTNRAITFDHTPTYTPPPAPAAPSTPAGRAAARHILTTALTTRLS